MKFFTPNLIKRLSSSDEAVARVAHDEWENALERYDSDWKSIELELPESIREFNNLLVHDAVVLSIVRQRDQLTMVVRKTFLLGMWSS